MGFYGEKMGLLEKGSCPSKKMKNFKIFSIFYLTLFAGLM